MKKLLFAIAALVGGTQLQAQTAFDVIANSPNHNLLQAALETTGLDAALSTPDATFTVFAPDDAAVNALIVELNITVDDLLALPNLEDILLYHVLPTIVSATDITNGLLAEAISPTNTLKLTKKANNDVFVNQAQVTAADITASNGVVHVIDAVVLPNETVVDVAIDNNFTSLTTAVVTAELLPALTNPFATLTVFAPTNDAFTAIATGLGTDINGLLALPNLADILTYHVLGARVVAADITNGQIATPLSTTNTLKLTKKANGDVFVNQAQVLTPNIEGGNGVVHVIGGVVVPFETVVDVAIDNGFTSLTTAVVTAELLPALTNPLATLTVFAPTNDAFTAIATGLGTDIAGLLALPNLADILTYHVLGTEVEAADITNGQIVSPLSTTNTLKLTKKANGDVFVNQAQVVTPNIDGGNGIVHVLNAVVVPFETVVDVALDNGFTSLATAVVTAELLPALTNPLATLTVFAPTNDAFTAIAAGLGTDIAGLLALPNLADILTYHVLGSEVEAADITNGQIVSPLSTTNTLKLTKKANGDVFVNQAQVVTPNIDGGNGIVHVLNAVVVPFETVADVAIDNGFSTLVTAVVTAELLPALTNPLASLTVFAPTNAAFDAAALALGTDLAGILALPNLADILLYHVVGSEALAASLADGQLITTLQGTDVIVDLVNPNVFINQAQVVTADIDGGNGVVHVINAVLLPEGVSINEVTSIENLSVYPNPASEFVTLSYTASANENVSYRMTDLSGKSVIVSDLGIRNGAQIENIDLSNVASGMYILEITSGTKRSVQKVSVK